MSQVQNWPQTIDDFDRLIEATQNELIHFAVFRLGNRADAEDVVQDVYVEAFRDRVKRKHVTGVRPYLFRMVGNRCVDILRTRSRRAGEPAREESTSSSDDAFSLLAAGEQAEAVSRLLGSIPRKEAEVIRLRAFSDLSFPEIAEAVGSSVSTVKSRFRYGLDKLRRKLCPREVCDELPRSCKTND